MPVSPVRPTGRSDSNWPSERESRNRRLQGSSCLVRARLPRRAVGAILPPVVLSLHSPRREDGMERRRFLVKAGGVLVAAGATAAMDAPSVIAQPKVQWRMATSWTPALAALQG